MARPEIPQEFNDYALGLLGEERGRRVLSAFGDEPSVSVRLHPVKAAWAGLSADTLPCADGAVPWAAPEGVYLSGRPPFTSDPLLHAGAYYVQDASSMAIACALRRFVNRPVMALDLCAAPGGKSTHLRALLPEGSLLVSNEPVKARTRVLLENMTKWGHPDVVVTHSFPRDFSGLTDLFDLVVADVPCSGEGMFRKEEAAVTGWSMDNVRMCRDRQREIVRDIWPSLKPGGLLIYSTCTLNSWENEENVDFIASTLGGEVLAVDTSPEWGVTGNLLHASPENSLEKDSNDFPVCRFIPGLSRGEGFFMAVVRKSGTDFSDSPDTEMRLTRRVNTKTEKGRKKEQPRSVMPSSCKSWFLRPDDFDFQLYGEVWTAIPKRFAKTVDLLRGCVEIWQAGIPTAVVKGKDCVPQHALAMSVALSRAAFPVVALPYAQAVAYLRKETPSLPAETPKGHVLLTYRNTPLGFVKNVGGRANNLYPAEWKIRTTQPLAFSLGGEEDTNMRIQV